jgi:hypothetical protein
LMTLETVFNNPFVFLATSLIVLRCTACVLEG